MIVQIVLLAGWMGMADAPPSQVGSEQTCPSDTRRKTIAECRRLSPDDCSNYIERLAEEKNYVALKELCQAGFGYANTVYVGILDDKEAVCYCKSLPFCSRQWEHAFWGLSFHRKDRVEIYVKEVYSRGTAYARQQCYQLCLKAGWDTLVKNAKSDIHDKTLTDPPGWTLGAQARMYLQLLPEVQKRLTP